MKTENNENEALNKTDVSGSLFNLSINEKYSFLRKKIYERIETSHTGRLLINTKYCRQVAEILGGNYDTLTSVQKTILKSDIVTEQICVEGGIERYTRH